MNDPFISEIIKNASPRATRQQKTLLANQCGEMHRLYGSQLFSPEPVLHFLRLIEYGLIDSEY